MASKRAVGQCFVLEHMADQELLLGRIGSVLAPALSSKCTVSMHTQLQASGLQLLDVNTSFLDSLVLDYLAAEDFVEVRASVSGGSVSCTCCRNLSRGNSNARHPTLQEDNAEAQEQIKHRLAALTAFQQLQQGSVSDAMAIASRYCPSVLEVRRCALLLLQANTPPSRVLRTMMLELCIHKPRASSEQPIGVLMVPPACLLSLPLHIICMHCGHAANGQSRTLHVGSIASSHQSSPDLLLLSASVAAGPAALLQAEASAVH